MLAIDLTGKRALVAGVSDDGGFGFAIAKSLAEAGASVCVGSWPPALGIFTKLLERGKLQESSRLPDGRTLEFERIYPLDAAYDTIEEAPAEIRENKRYKDQGDFSITGLCARIEQDFGNQALDIVVHSLANAPEVKSPLVDTSRQGYLAAVGVSAYSNVSLVRNLSPLMRPHGAFLSLTYLAGRAGHSGVRRRHVVRQGRPGSGHPDARLRSGTPLGSAGQRDLRRTLGVAGGLGDRLHRHDDQLRRCQLAIAAAIDATDVGSTAAFLCSPLSRAITGSVIYVDNGFNVMGMAVPPDPS